MKNFKEISARLEIAKKKLEKNITKDQSSNAASLGKALKISTELVAAVVVGSLLGFILDSWFDTKPWLTISFFFMGVAAGILNVIRSAKNMHKNKDMENRVHDAVMEFARELHELMNYPMINVDPERYFDADDELKEG